MGPLKYQMPKSFIDFRPYERSTIYHAIDAARSNHAGTSNRCVTLDVSCSSAVSLYRRGGFFVGKCSDQTKRVMVFDKAIRHLGSTIGMRPLTFFIASAVLFFVSISYLLLLPLKIHLGFDSGYTTTDAPSIRELQTQIDYFGNKGKPWYMALFAEPREQTEGSMTDFKEFNEFERFYKAIKTNIIIRKDKNHNITYMDYCDTTCNINEQIFKTHGDEVIRSKLSALYFMAFINSSQAANDMKNFEEKVSEWVANHNANGTKLTTITQHSARGMQLEIIRGMKFVVAKLLGGMMLTTLFTLSSFIVLNKIRGRSNTRVAPLALASGVMPLMSAVNALAACSLFGMHINTITVTSPALSFAIGIDGVLMLYNAWISVGIHNNVKDHVTEVFAAVVPSMTIVSGTSLGLLAGILFPIEEFANFSCYLGVTVLFLYMNQIFFFPSVMVWCSPVATHRPLVQEVQKLPELPEKKKIYMFLGLCITICTFPFKFDLAESLYHIVVMSMSRPYHVSGIHQVTLEIATYQHLLQVWPEFFNIIFFIKKPPQFDDPSSYQQFRKMISEIESLPGNIKNSSMMWINDYERHTGMIGNETVLNMTQFEDFITHHVYKAWNSGVRYRLDGNNSVITSMMYFGAFEGTRSMMDKAVLLSHCRQIVAKYPEFDTVPFDTEVGMVDVILQIPYVTFYIPLLVITTYSVVSLVLIGNLAVSLVAIVSIASIYLGRKRKFFFILNHSRIRPTGKLLEAFWINAKNPAMNSRLCSFLPFVPMIFTNVAVFRWLAVINLCCLLIGTIYALFLIPLILSWIHVSLAGREFFCAAKKTENLALKSFSS
ncbi:hypothetical protein Angca_008969 [Angiostrongylus cantonensis]|nr:hypothetical protein Angca_008969 [Angiostrongylus cantonensis]